MPNTEKKSLPIESQRFRSILKMLDLDQKKFSDPLKTSSTIVTSWATKGKLPSGTIIKKMMKHYPINFRYWFLGEGNPLIDQQEIAQMSDSERSRFHEHIGKKDMQIEDLKRTNRQLMLDRTAPPISPKTGDRIKHAASNTSFISTFTAKCSRSSSLPFLFFLWYPILLLFNKSAINVQFFGISPKN